MKHVGRGWLFAGLLAAAWLVPSRAEAGGFFLVTYGDAIKDLGELPADSQAVLLEAAHKPMKFGFKYSYIGLFWIDLWDWGGEFCLYHDHEFWPLTLDEAAQHTHKPVTELKKPFFYRYPEGLVILIGGFGLLYLIGLFLPAPPPEPAAETATVATAADLAAEAAHVDAPAAVDPPKAKPAPEPIALPPDDWKPPGA